MARVIRKRGETFESFLRRFNRRLMGSGRMIEARKYKHYTPAPTKRERKNSKLRGKKIAEKIVYLEKIGRPPVEKKKRGRR